MSDLLLDYLDSAIWIILEKDDEVNLVALFPPSYENNHPIVSRHLDFTRNYNEPYFIRYPLYKEKHKS